MQFFPRRRCTGGLGLPHRRARGDCSSGGRSAGRRRGPRTMEGAYFFHLSVIAQGMAGVASLGIHGFSFFFEKYSQIDP